MLFGDLHRVGHQHRDGQRTDAPRHWRVRARQSTGVSRTSNGQIKSIAPVFMPAFFITVSKVSTKRQSYAALPTDGSHQDIRAAAHFGKIRSLGMADGYGGVRMQQH